MDTMKRKTGLLINAKYRGKCAESGRQVLPGETVLWFPLERKVYKLDTDRADLWHEQKTVSEIQQVAA